MIKATKPKINIRVEEIVGGFDVKVYSGDKLVLQDVAAYLDDAKAWDIAQRVTVDLPRQTEIIRHIWDNFGDLIAKRHDVAVTYACHLLREIGLNQPTTFHELKRWNTDLQYGFSEHELDVALQKAGNWNPVKKVYQR